MICGCQGKVADVAHHQLVAVGRELIDVPGSIKSQYLLLITDGLLRLKKEYENTIQNSFFESQKIDIENLQKY